MKAIPMWQCRIALMFGVATAVSACGSASTDPGGNNNNNNANNTSSCAVTLSGARTGSPTCSKVTAVWTSNNNKTGFGIGAASSSDTVNVAIGFDGEPTTTTYTTASGASAVMLLFGGGGGWENNPAGGWTLTLTSVHETSSGAGLKGYEVHGTLTATLLSIVGTTVSPVTVAATF